MNELAGTGLIRWIAAGSLRRIAFREERFFGNGVAEVSATPGLRVRLARAAGDLRRLRRVPQADDRQVFAVGLKLDV